MASALTSPDPTNAAFARLLEHGGAATWHIQGSPEGRVLACNDAMAALLDAPRTAIVGAPVRRWWHPAFDACIAALRNASDGEVRRLRVAEPDPTGRERVFLADATAPVRGGDIWMTLRDVTHDEKLRRIPSVLRRVAEAVDRCKTLALLGANIHAELTALIDTANFYVALYDEKTELYSFPFAADERDGPEEFVPQRLPRSMTDYVRRTGEPLLATEPTFARLKAAGEVDLVGADSPVWMGVPLRTSRGVIGVIGLQSYRYPDLYTPEDVELLTIVSAAVARAMEQKWSEQLRREVEAGLARETELEIRRDEAIRANLAKSSFLLRMSHELRTPLNAIVGYAELVIEDLEDKGVEDPIDDLRAILTSAGDLTKILGDLLDLTKLESGEVTPSLEAVDVRELLEDVSNVVAPQIAAGGHTLQTTVDAGVGTVICDVHLLEEALLQLISNACKFTVHGTIGLAARRGHGEQGDHVEIAVSDTGIGMAPEIIERMFEPFTQADASTTRRHGGTGVGLTLVRHISALLGGDIDIASTPGAGTTATITLPADIPQSVGQKST